MYAHLNAYVDPGIHYLQCPMLQPLMLMWVQVTYVDEGAVYRFLNETMRAWRSTQMVRDAVVWCADTVV
jgi:hypothetical protein